MKSITRFTQNTRGSLCLNCGNHITDEDNFCSKCGQVNDTNRLSLKQYFSEYLSGFYNFDNRFFKTIIPLLIHPGRVTKNYVEGMRMRYVNPFQLYLHITILFFLLVGLFDTFDKFNPNETDPIVKGVITRPDEAKKAIDSIQTELAKEDIRLDTTTLSIVGQNLGIVENEDEHKKQIKRLRAERMTRNYVDSLLLVPPYNELLENPSLQKNEKDTIAKKMLTHLDSLMNNKGKKNDTISKSKWRNIGKLWMTGSTRDHLKKTAAYRIENQLFDKEVSYTVPAQLVVGYPDTTATTAAERVFNKLKYFMDYDQVYPEAEPEEALAHMGYPNNYWNEFYYNKSQDINKAVVDKEFQQELIDRVLGKVTVALFFLLPLFTMVVSLLYYRNRYNYSEHLVFVFHVQTVFFLLLIIFMTLNRLVGLQSYDSIFVLLFLFYLYKAMRNFYGQGRFKTIIKYLILNNAFMILASVGAVIISFIAFTL